jgi:hypothetical protein
MPKTVTMNKRETATVLAALRTFQKEHEGYRNAMPHFEEVKPLNDEEIDTLCEQINLGEKG